MLKRNTKLKPEHENIVIGNAVNQVMEQGSEWLKNEIKSMAKSELQKLMIESNAYMRTVTKDDNRTIWRSRFYNDLVTKAAKSTLPFSNFPNPINPLAAALPENLNIENMLDEVSLTETADAVFSDGIIRRVISDVLDYVLPDYTKFAVVKDKTFDKFSGQLEKNDFIELQDKDIAKYHIHVSRLLERTHFYDFQLKLLASSIIFGRNALYIPREPTDNIFHKYGKPKGFVLLNPLSIKKALVKNDQTVSFDGFEYDFGTKDKNLTKISRDNLIPFFYDDWNIYKNTYYSGMTRIFSLVGLAHSNQLINSYDLPEATKSIYRGNNYIYVGTPSSAIVDKFADADLGNGNHFHDQAALHVEEAKATSEIIQILETRLSNYKSICMILGLPLFLLFEDEANFATAAIAMQSFINGRIRRLSNQFGDTMAEYLFMPLMSDILNIDLDRLLDRYVHRVKAIMPPITLETKTDKVTNACQIWDRGGFFGKWSQFFKYIGEDQLAELAEPLDQLVETFVQEEQDADINEIMGNENQMGRMARRGLTDFNVKTSSGERNAANANATSTQGQTGN